MWPGIGRRHHSPPANLSYMYSVVCVFPGAEVGRSLRVLTLFGAEWCCCLVPLPLLFQNWRDTSPQTSILAAAAGGFNRFLLLLSFIVGYGKRVF